MVNAEIFNNTSLEEDAINQKWSVKKCPVQVSSISIFNDTPHGIGAQYNIYHATLFVEKKDDNFESNNRVS